MLKTALLALAAAGVTIPALAAETDVLDQPVDPFEQVVREIEHTVICNWINLQIEKRRTKIAAVTYPTPEEQLFLLVSLAQQQEECGIDNTAEINGLNGGVHEVWLSSSDG